MASAASGGGGDGAASPAGAGGAPTAARNDHGRTQTPVLELTGESTPLPTLLGGLVRGWRLLPMLARQDFHSRYRSASLGLVWSVILPLLQGAVLAIVFTHVVKVHTALNYPVFVILGMNLWAYFNASFQTGSTAIVDGGGIAGKVYFPRLLLAAVPTGSNFVGFAISMAVVLGLMGALSVPFHPTLLALPAAMLLVALLAVLCSEIAALLHVYFRDVRYTVTALLLVLFYATPVIYPLSFTKGLAPIVEANPLTGIVQLARWSVFSSVGALGVPLAATAAWIVGLTLVTLLAFARYERIACDRL